MLTVVPSVDVEAAHGPLPFEQLILGQIGNGRDCGVHRISDILSRYRARGTFFVDVYEYTLWGEPQFQSLLNDLYSSSMDVQLHTHPSWRWDSRDSKAMNDYKQKHSFFPPHKDLMAKLTKTEQADVISHGIEKMIEWTSIAPSIHRSGGYSVNQDTLSALASVGINYDSSVNSASSNTLIEKEKNGPYFIGPIVEFPLTTAKLRASFTLWPTIELGEIKTELKNYRLEMLIDYAEQCIAMGLKYMSLFMHSYDLMSFSSGWRSAVENKNSIDVLEKFLAWCDDHDNVQVKSYSELTETQTLRGILEPTASELPTLSAPVSRLYAAGIRRLKKLAHVPRTIRRGGGGR